ncbi:hypothetical protein OAT18_00795 [Tenacibaculum sp.]|nr:hypothetical protein [Tenacibaculum sp.]
MKSDLIKLFNEIKNITYKIIDIEYTLESSYKLIQSDGASCTPKHIVLAEKFNKLGIETRFCIHEFSWSSFETILPYELLKLSKKLPIDYHTNLEVKIDEVWVLLDVTWDDGLIDKGFIGTKDWDGETSTLNCVNSLKEYKFNSLKERANFIKSKIEGNNNQLKDQREFIEKINNFFEELRNKK